jgi:hypothetical protein
MPDKVCRWVAHSGLLFVSVCKCRVVCVLTHNWRSNILLKLLFLFFITLELSRLRGLECIILVNLVNWEIPCLLTLVSSLLLRSAMPLRILLVFEVVSLFEGQAWSYNFIGEGGLALGGKSAAFPPRGSRRCVASGLEPLQVLKFMQFIFSPLLPLMLLRLWLRRWRLLNGGGHPASAFECCSPGSLSWCWCLLIWLLVSWLKSDSEVDFIPSVDCCLLSFHCFEYAYLFCCFFGEIL